VGVWRLTYHNYDGYAPIAGYLGLEGLCIEAQLRPGSQHSQKGFLPFLDRVILPISAKVSTHSSKVPTHSMIQVKLDTFHKNEWILWTGTSEDFELESLGSFNRSGWLDGPKLAIGNKAMGFWAALAKVYSETRVQRCWVHKTANVLNKGPNSVQPKMKESLHEIWMAETQEGAHRAFDIFADKYEAKHPKAVKCLEKDRRNSSHSTTSPLSTGSTSGPLTPHRVHLRHGETAHGQDQGGFKNSSWLLEMRRAPQPPTNKPSPFLKKVESEQQATNKSKDRGFFECALKCMAHGLHLGGMS